MRSLANSMKWLHEPEWGVEDDVIRVRTQPDTDFWQRTHYGFRRDNAHALVEEASGDFRLHGHFRFFPTAQYDQCGLYLRVDEDNWFKCSVEFENPRHSRLGSVITRGGYSDWATQDIPSDVQAMAYRIDYVGGDLIASWSRDGGAWRQMRIAHLADEGKPVLAGFYGCSPTGKGFRFEVHEFGIERE